MGVSVLPRMGSRMRSRLEPAEGGVNTTTLILQDIIKKVENRRKAQNDQSAWAS